MVGRPRRRHVVAHSGQLQRNTLSVKAPEKFPAITDQRRSRSRFSLPKKVRIAAFVVFAAAVVSIGWVLTAGALSYNKIVDRTGDTKPALSFLSGITQNKLKGESENRINVLLIGVGGANHPGGTLADTIMVASVNPKTKQVALLSVPRDLYIDYDNGKREGKINSVNSYGDQNPKTTGGGAALMKQTVGDVLGIPIHYYVKVDFTALQKIVDTLGGITVDVDTAIVDLQYPADNMIDYAPFRLAAGVQKLDGKTALKYVRSRHGGNGEGSDFARAKRQQKTLAAIKEKALSLGVLTNPKKIADIITILGDHVKTDISAVEAEHFFEIVKDVDSTKMNSMVLDNGVNGPLVAHNGDARGSILLTKTGDYSELQAIARDIFAIPQLQAEKASVGLINASGSTATSSYVTSLLRYRGFEVTDITPKGQLKETKSSLVKNDDTKPGAESYLEGQFKVTATVAEDGIANSKYDLILTVGSDYKLPTPSIKPTATKKTTPSPKTSPTPATSEGTDDTATSD